MTENENLKIEYIPVDKLKPYERNARKHADIDVDAIAASIQAFGFRDPIGVWGKNNVIVEGHGRLLAAKKLGMDSVPCIRLDDMTDEQRRGYALAHNKTAELSKWSNDLLKIEIDDLEEKFQFEDFGFDLEEELNNNSEEPEIKFTEVLGEEHNYVVLYFDNEVDWTQIEGMLDITQKKNLSTRKDGKIGKNMQRISVGRVINGAEAMEKIRRHYENIN